MEAICGGRRPARWDDPCRLDLAAAAAGVSYTLLVLVMTLVWHTARRRRSRVAPLPRRFRLHALRWALALLVALLSLAGLMDALLSEWYSKVQHPHVIVAPVAALLAIGAVTGLTCASERDAAPGRLLANLTYCGTAAAISVCKVHFYQSVEGLGVQHVRVIVTWTTMFLYVALTMLEVYFAFEEVSVRAD